MKRVHIFCNASVIPAQTARPDQSAGRGVELASVSLPRSSSELLMFPTGLQGVRHAHHAPANLGCRDLSPAPAVLQDRGAPGQANLSDEEIDVMMTVRWLRAMLPQSRSTNTVDVGKPIDTGFRVLPGDLDMLMHMTNGRYLSILDAARISYMSRTGLWRQLRARRWHPVVAAQTIVYRRPLTLGVRYHVHTTLLGFDERNAYFEQSFRVGSSVHADAVVAVRFLDRDGDSVTPQQILDVDARFVLSEPLPAWIPSWLESARRHGAATSTDHRDVQGIHLSLIHI